MNNQNDWNIADDLPENERLYVRVVHWTGDSDLLIPAQTSGTKTLLPAEWIDGAYTLADAGDSAEGWEMLRLPNGMRVSVMSSYLQYYTKVNPEKIYKTHIELDHIKPFQFKDASSQDEVVSDAPEWLNNLCNRIDALEAQVEELEDNKASNSEMDMMISRELSNFDFSETIQGEPRSYDFSDAVQNEIDEMDFKEMVQDEIKNFDFKNIVMSLLSEPEFTQALAQAMNTMIRQQVMRQLHAVKTETPDTSTIWKNARDFGKGWR